MVKFNLICLLIFNIALLNAQDYKKYEPNEQFPFGRPHPDAPSQIKDFEPMIGKCKCTTQTRNPDGSWNDPGEMIWTFRYIMNGWGVQDETLKDDGGHSGSLRQYIADSARWYVHYYSNVGPTTVLPTWEGNVSESKDKIVLYRDQTAPNGMEGKYRLTFYDFSKSGYKWIGEWVDPAEQIVYPTWKIECTRSDE